MNTKTISYLALAASAGTLLTSCKVVSDVKEISENVNTSTENIRETARYAYKTSKYAVGIAACAVVFSALWFIRRKR